MLRTIALIFTLTMISSLPAASAPDRYAGTPSDPWIPNFAHAQVAGGPVIKTRQSGDWSDPATWGGAVPGRRNVVIVEHNVLLAGNVNVRDIVVYPNGFLRFARNENTRLTIGTLQVLRRGRLEIGSPRNPIARDTTVEIIFADRAIDTDVDPGQYGQGLIVLGTATISGAPVNANFVRLTAEPKAGDLTLRTSGSLDGWQPGGRLVLPDSRQTDPRVDRGFVSQTEVIEIANVSVATGEVTLSTPVRHDHPGARDAQGVLEFLPHAAYLSANVILRSANPQGTRGHAQFLYRANVDIRYALFKDLGRTTANPLDETEFDDQGNATYIGSNQSGRYPIHAHHLNGPKARPGHGFQYAFIGNAVDGGDFDHAFKWGIAVHASHYGLVLKNSVYNYAGSGIATEDGSETGNVFDRNFVARCSAFGRLDVNDRGTAGTAFWFRGQNNIMRRNIAADARNSGFSINAYRLGEVRVPRAQGNLARVTVNMNTLPILSFSQNETYGPAKIGLDLWEIGSTGDTLHDVERSIIHNLKVWHHYDRALTIYRTHRITFNGVVVRGDTEQLNNRYTDPIGFDLTDPYRARDFIINRADIQGQRTGIKLDFSGVPADTVGKLYNRPSPQNGSFNTTIQKSVLNNYTNLDIKSRQNLGSPRRTVVCSTSFDTVNVDLSRQRSLPYDVIRSYDFGLDRNLVSADEVDIYNYNGDRRADFGVFSEEQAPNFVIPRSSDDGRRIGSPVEGLTNRQNRARYGISVADEISPCTDASSYPGVAGFSCPLDSADDSADVSRPTSPAFVRVNRRRACRGEVRLSWVSSCDDRGIAGYTVSRDGVDIGTVSDTKLNDTNLDPGNYRYRVRARDRAGHESVPTTHVSVTVPENCQG